MKFNTVKLSCIAIALVAGLVDAKKASMGVLKTNLKKRQNTSSTKSFEVACPNIECLNCDHCIICSTEYLECCPDDCKQNSKEYIYSQELKRYKTIPTSTTTTGVKTISATPTNPYQNSVISFDPEECKDVNCGTPSLEDCDEKKEFCCGMTHCSNLLIETKTVCSNVRCPPQYQCELFELKCCGYRACHINKFRATTTYPAKAIPRTTKTVASTQFTLALTTTTTATTTTDEVVSTTTVATKAPKKIYNPCDLVPKCWRGMKCWSKDALRCCGSDCDDESYSRIMSLYTTTTKTIATTTTLVTKSPKRMPCDLVPKCWKGMQCWTMDALRCCGSDCDDESYSRIMSLYTTTTSKRIPVTIRPIEITTTLPEPVTTTTVESTPTNPSYELCKNVNCGMTSQICDETQQFCCGVRQCKNSNEEDKSECKPVRCPPLSECDEDQLKCCGYFACNINSFKTSTRTKTIPTTSKTLPSDQTPTAKMEITTTVQSQATTAKTKATKRHPCAVVPKCYYGMVCRSKDEAACCQEACDRQSYEKFFPSK